MEPLKYETTDFKYVTEFIAAIKADDIPKLESLLKKYPNYVNDTDSHVSDSPKQVFSSDLLL